MTNSSVLPSYPSAVLPWTDRIDAVSIDYAADINSIAAEIESVETTTGTNPQIEPNPPVGNPVAYSTVSARISDAMNNNLMPYTSLAVSSFNIPFVQPGILVPFKAVTDPLQAYNGTDITIPSSGWWLVGSRANWSWSGSGYSYHSMTVNGLGNIVDDDLIDWSFSGNALPVTAPDFLTPAPPPTTIPSPPPMTIPSPPWQIPGKRPRITSTFFMGPLHKGDRVSVYTENGTSLANYLINSIQLQAYMCRPLTGVFVSV